MSELQTWDAHTSRRWDEICNKLQEEIETIDKDIAYHEKGRGKLLIQIAEGEANAATVLTKLDLKLTALRRDLEIKRSAMVLSQGKRSKALEGEAAKIEQARQRTMADLAVRMITHAQSFTSHLQEASRAARSVHATLNSMTTLATIDERANLQRLWESGPFLRAAEYSGLRSFLPVIPSYPGPREHITSLEEAFAVHLSRWIELQTPSHTPSQSDTDELRKETATTNDTRTPVSART